MKHAPGQQTLFGEERRSALPQYDAAAPPVPCNSTVEPCDAARLSANTRHVLARLRQGPATGPELLDPEIGGIGFKQRIYELRRAGYAILRRHVKDGVHEYRLADRGQE